MTITPAMKQYYDLKADHEDAILFFRMGDFYEMFEDDAKIAHEVLGISLTSRNKKSENPVLLAWIPFHAKEKYLPLLLEAGYKVAIAEQVSDPKAKGIVEREVQRVVTPATASLELDWNDSPKTHQCLVSIVKLWDIYGFSSLDLENHKWICSEFIDFTSLSTELYKIFPWEIILEKSLSSEPDFIKLLQKKYNSNIFYYSITPKPYKYLLDFFGSKNLEWYWIEDKQAAQKASALLHMYLCENQKKSFSYIKNLSYECFSGFMWLDESTIKSLDLVYNISTGSQSEWTLFWVLNETKTPMGKRYLKQQLLNPLQKIDDIKNRQELIKAFKDDTILLDKVRSELKYIWDLDIFLSRLSLQRVGPADLVKFKKSLISIKNIQKLVLEAWNKKLINLLKI